MAANPKFWEEETECHRPPWENYCSECVNKFVAHNNYIYIYIVYIYMHAGILISIVLVSVGLDLLTQLCVSAFIYLSICCRIELLVVN